MYSGVANHCRSNNHEMALNSQERSKTNHRLHYCMVTESLKLINIAVVIYLLAYYLLFLHVRVAGKWSGGGGGGGGGGGEGCMCTPCLSPGSASACLHKNMCHTVILIPVASFSIVLTSSEIEAF